MTRRDAISTLAGGLWSGRVAPCQNSNIGALYLTDGTHTLEPVVVRQTANEIQFRIPDQAAPGPWVPAEKRPHIWTILLQTSSQDLLDFVGFRIGIE